MFLTKELSAAQAGLGWVVLSITGVNTGEGAIVIIIVIALSSTHFLVLSIPGYLSLESHPHHHFMRDLYSHCYN